MVSTEKVSLSESSTVTAEKMPLLGSPIGIAEAIDLPDNHCVKASINLLRNRKVESDVTAHVEDPEKVGSPALPNRVNAKKASIDTAVPFESVKEAVSRFGGSIDWTARRSQTQRRKSTGEELDKSKGIAELRRESEAIGDKNQLSEELYCTNKLIEELKLNLERTEREKHQATQESELVRLRVEELEQEIANGEVKSQFEVDQARNKAAVSDLKAIKEELETSRKEYVSMAIQRNLAVKLSEEAVAASKKVEKTVKCLTIELESLELAAHMGSVHKGCRNWKLDLQHAEEKLQRLNQQVLSVKDLESKLDAASSLLLDLKAELAAYMESKLKEEGDEERKQELEEVKLNIEKATAEVNSVLATIRRSEETTFVAVASLIAELYKTRSEITLVEMKENEAREKMIELPMKLEQAEQEADQAKSLAQAAQIELSEAKEEAEQAKDRASTMKSGLLAAQTELEDAKSSEKLAIEAIKALQESESAADNSDMDSPSGMTLGLEEYYELTKQAHEAKKQANLKVTAANSQIEIAKESELRSLNKLEELNQELAARRETLKMATEKSKKAKEAKLAAEQELREWKAEQKQQRNASSNGEKGSNDSDQTNMPSNDTVTEAAPETKSKKKKKFFPRVVMFFAKRKSHSNKRV